MKTSFSQNNTYIQCPKHWSFNYIAKLKAPTIGASLPFGAAVDESIMELLKGNVNYMNRFFNRWDKAKSFGKTMQVFDNQDVVYANADFDEYILDDSDKKQLDTWVSELNVSYLSSDGVECYKEAKKKKMNPYKSVTAKEMKYFNRASWLSLRKKGELLITSFNDQFYPKIKRVLAVQQWSSWKNPFNGDTMVGIIDMVLEIEGYDSPIIFDLKTAARAYTDSNIELNDQLPTYLAMEGHKYNTDLVGFAVLCKNIPKIVTAKCTSCGFMRNGRHKTCNNKVMRPNGKLVRCDGAWDEKQTPDPKVQVLVKQLSAQDVDDCLEDSVNIMKAMKNKIIYKNKNKCNNWYGNICPYFQACHNNDISGLVKK